jgi:hypothetical protein
MLIYYIYYYFAEIFNEGDKEKCRNAEKQGKNYKVFLEKPYKRKKAKNRGYFSAFRHFVYTYSIFIKSFFGVFRRFSAINLLNLL